MSSEKTKHSRRRGAALALAAVLLLAATPAAAGPLAGKAEAMRAVTPLVEAWEGVWGWLTAVWGEQGNGADFDGPPIPPGDQGHGIDPNGAKKHAGNHHPGV